MRIIDFHTHAFPDLIAETAIPFLEKEAHISASHDGKVHSLLRSMDMAGIQRSVVASIATKVSQFESVLSWSVSIQSERIIPFPSVHPDDPDILEHIEVIAGANMKGIKLHPYYQKFVLDEDRMIPVYKKIEECGLILLCHTGFDMGFPRDRTCDPVKIRRVLDLVPDMNLVTTHFGAWEDWNEVEKHLLGSPVYMDVSYSIEQLGRERALRFIHSHPREYILFGTDSPWEDQKKAVEVMSGLGLDDVVLRRIMGENAGELLEF